MSNRCKDKFLVQAIKIPEDLMKISKEDAQEKLQELWAIAELSKKTDSNSLTGIICEKRLKCVYLPSLESRNAVTHNDSKSQSFFDYRQKGSQLPNVQPSSSLSDLTEKELKETIKKLSAACEGYKAEIDRLNDLRKSKVLNEKGGEISTQSGATVALSEISGIKPLDAFLISLVAFLIEKELMSTSKSLVIDHWDDTVVEEDTYTQNPVTVITESSRSEYKPQIKLLQRKPEVAVSNKMETRTVSKPKEKTKEERELEYKLTREKIFNEKDEKLSSRNNSKLEEKKTTDHWDDS
ncbi:hypothetical protein HK099_004668 [Clydaea vesicula]|uniref:SUZ domain-containing protein n=1 Tax=Clydaea vesicula TaxID=447962 RepID=A0AAD5U062_9FUNG|nr:hypothetical protein HK099_004668 [Clydaea vesicula]